MSPSLNYSSVPHSTRPSIVVFSISFIHEHRSISFCLLKLPYLLYLLHRQAPPQSIFLFKTLSNLLPTKMPDMNKTMPVINQYTVADCKNITPLCPVDQTIYGYYPNLGANAFFLALFAILCAVNIAQGIKYKTWTYMIAHRGYWYVSFSTYPYIHGRYVLISPNRLRRQSHYA